MSDDPPFAINETWLDIQANFSASTFGPGLRTKGISDHIRKELDEIAEAPEDLEEWIDVVILGLDGAWRVADKLGLPRQKVLDMYTEKIVKNIRRDWPDWRNASEDVPIEHIRTEIPDPLKCVACGQPRANCLKMGSFNPCCMHCDETDGRSHKKEGS